MDASSRSPSDATCNLVRGDSLTTGDADVYAMRRRDARRVYRHLRWAGALCTTSDRAGERQTRSAQSATAPPGVSATRGCRPNGRWVAFSELRHATSVPGRRRTGQADIFVRDRSVGERHAGARLHTERRARECLELRSACQRRIARQRERRGHRRRTVRGVREPRRTESSCPAGYQHGVADVFVRDRPARHDRARERELERRAGETAGGSQLGARWPDARSRRMAASWGS